MTDVSDNASDLEELHRTVAWRVQLNRAGMDGKTTDDSATDCHDCDEPIPQARREAVPGCLLCVECQGQREKTFYER